MHHKVCLICSLKIVVWQLQLLSMKKRESSVGGTTPMMFNLNKENEGSWSNNGSDENNSIDVNLGTRTSSGDSPFYSKNVFPPEPGPGPGPIPLTQFLQSSSTPDLTHCHKNIDPTVQDEGFCNMFNPVDDQTNFWPWPEQQHFN